MLSPGIALKEWNHQPNTHHLVWLPKRKRVTLDAVLRKGVRRIAEVPKWVWLDWMGIIIQTSRERAIFSSGGGGCAVTIFQRKLRGVQWFGITTRNRFQFSQSHQQWKGDFVAQQLIVISAVAIEWMLRDGQREKGREQELEMEGIFNISSMRGEGPLCWHHYVLRMRFYAIVPYSLSNVCGISSLCDRLTPLLVVRWKFLSWCSYSLTEWNGKSRCIWTWLILWFACQCVRWFLNYYYYSDDSSILNDFLSWRVFITDNGSPWSAVRVRKLQISSV